MGTQFWWFYDIIVAAILLISIFVSGKKGSMKSVYTLMACIISIVVAYGLSGSLSKVIYESSMKTSSTKKLYDHIDDETFINAYKGYLESTYRVSIRYETLEDIFAENTEDHTDSLIQYINNINGHKMEKDDEVLRDKLYEGYSVVVRDLVSQAMNNKYVTEYAAKLSAEDRANIQKMIPLITNPDDQRKGAAFIAEHYVAKPYQTIFRLVAFVLIFIILTLLIEVTIRAMIGSRRDNKVTLRSHLGGGIIGIFTGGIFVLAAAVCIRLWTIMGSNEMLFFNNDAVDKSYVFRYFYQIAEML